MTISAEIQFDDSASAYASVNALAQFLDNMRQATTIGADNVAITINLDIGSQAPTREGTQIAAWLSRRSPAHLEKSGNIADIVISFAQEQDFEIGRLTADLHAMRSEYEELRASLLKLDAHNARLTREIAASGDARSAPMTTK